MKNSGKFQNSMRAVTINSEFSLPGLILGTHVILSSAHPPTKVTAKQLYS